MPDRRRVGGRAPAGRAEPPAGRANGDAGGAAGGVYRAFGDTVTSELPLPELPATEAPGEEGAGVTLALAAVSGSDAGGWVFSHAVAENGGRPWLRVARRGTDYRLEFPGLATFDLRGAGRHVECRPAPGVPPETIRHLFLDHVLPRAASARGRLVLHASAVATASGAVALLGTAGGGKSTLAAFLARRGHRLVADDALVLSVDSGRWLAAPGYPGVRLGSPTAARLGWTAAAGGSAVAHYAGKRRWSAATGDAAFEPRLLPLACVHLLEPRAAPSGPAAAEAAPLRGAPAFMALYRHAFRLAVHDGPGLAREFAAFARLAAAVPITRLRFLHDLSRLPEVADVILRSRAETTSGDE